VLAYVGVPQRTQFARLVRELPAVWLSNEAPGVVPGLPTGHLSGGKFVLIRDGTETIAYTDGHGASVEWLPGS
jgi:hypothetical protein